MKRLLGIACVLLSVACISVRAADESQLQPNAKLRFEFPDLPETFFSKAKKESHPALLSAQLPENYTREGKFPLFVFLNGGNGGRGDSTLARTIAGPRDFITVSLPLFKDPSGVKLPPFPDIPIDLNQIVNITDAPVLASAYRVMLQKLFEAVPNIAAERSVLGGFSNGAHATGALLAAKDEFILNHFTSFCLFEGGLALMMDPTVLQQPEFKRRRFIVLFGDHDDDPKLRAQRKLVAGPLIESMTKQASALQLDFTPIVMHGYGHQMPPEYQKLLGNWVRGEKLPEIQPKENASPGSAAKGH